MKRGREELKSESLSSLKKICKDYQLIVAGKKNTLIERIINHESGIRSEYKKKAKASKTQPNAYVPFVEKTCVYFCSGNDNPVVENIPKPIWEKIFYYYTDKHSYLFPLRSLCKFFYIVISNVLTTLALKQFKVPDLELFLFCEWWDKKRNRLPSYASKLQSDLTKNVYFVNDSYNITFYAAQQFGSSEGIRLQLKINRELEKNDDERAGKRYDRLVHLSSVFPYLYKDKLVSLRKTSGWFHLACKFLTDHVPECRDAYRCISEYITYGKNEQFALKYVSMIDYTIISLAFHKFRFGYSHYIKIEDYTEAYRLYQNVDDLPENWWEKLNYEKLL